MKAETNAAVVLDAATLFAPLHKMRVGIGNSGATRCDVFTAVGFMVVKTNTGDFKAAADGELWPPIQMPLRDLRLLAKLYWRTKAPITFQRVGQTVKVGTTVFTL